MKSDTYCSRSDTSAYIKAGCGFRPAGAGWTCNEGRRRRRGVSDASAQHMCVFVDSEQCQVSGKTGDKDTAAGDPAWTLHGGHAPICLSSQTRALNSNVSPPLPPHPIHLINLLVPGRRLHLQQHPRFYLICLIN